MIRRFNIAAVVLSSVAVVPQRSDVPVTGASQFAQDGAGHIIGLTGQQPPPGFTLLKRVER